MSELMLGGVGDLLHSPVGVILAGGGGRRLGGDKARAQLAGRPLISYPVAVALQVLDDVVVVAKPDTRLPELTGIPVWREPQALQHPLVGILHALRTAAPRPVLVCAADLPFLTPAVLAELAFADALGGPAVVASAAGRLQPHLARYEPEALTALEAAPADGSLRATVAGLRPRLVEVPEAQLFNVNTATDLVEAEARLSRR